MIELITTGGENIQKKFISNLKARKGKGGIVVLLARSYQSIEKQLLDANIDPKQFQFIDVVDSISNPNVTHVAKGSLTSLSIAITELLHNLPGEDKFVLFDSLNPLNLYNKQSVVTRFILFLIEKLRSWDVDATFILSKEGENQQFVSLVESSVDKISN